MFEIICIFFGTISNSSRKQILIILPIPAENIIRGTLLTSNLVIIFLLPSLKPDIKINFRKKNFLDEEPNINFFQVIGQKVTG